jgi:hypothetical protein
MAMGIRGNSSIRLIKNNPGTAGAIGSENAVLLDAFPESADFLDAAANGAVFPMEPEYLRYAHQAGNFQLLEPRHYAMLRRTRSLMKPGDNILDLTTLTNNDGTPMTARNKPLRGNEPLRAHLLESGWALVNERGEYAPSKEIGQITFLEGFLYDSLPFDEALLRSDAALGIGFPKLYNRISAHGVHRGKHCNISYTLDGSHKLASGTMVPFVDFERDSQGDYFWGTKQMAKMKEDGNLRQIYGIMDGILERGEFTHALPAPQLVSSSMLNNAAGGDNAVNSIHTAAGPAVVSYDYWVYNHFRNKYGDSLEVRLDLGKTVPAANYVTALAEAPLYYVADGKIVGLSSALLSAGNEAVEQQLSADFPAVDAAQRRLTSHDYPRNIANNFLGTLAVYRRIGSIA